MKKIIILFLLPACLLACAQNDNSDNEPEKLNSKYVKLIDGNNKMMLIENVVIHYGDLYAEADSALWEKPKQTITVFGIRKASFKGKAIAPGESKDMIRYKKGEDRYYKNE